MRKITVWVTELVLLALFVLCLSGCTYKKAPAPQDPLEPWNRAVYQVNKTVDALTLKPAAKLYRGVVPVILRDRVSSVFDTIYLVPTVGNDLLQGNLNQATNDLARFVINLTLGFFGLFDVAKKAGLHHHQSDFGKTLAVWGYRKSTYLVLPLLGPSTVRDTAGRVVHYFMTPHSYLRSKERRLVYAVDLLRKREDLLDREKALLASAVDEYAVVRNSYLQYQDYAVEKQTGFSSDDVLLEDEMLGEPPE